MEEAGPSQTSSRTNPTINPSLPSVRPSATSISSRGRRRHGGARVVSEAGHAGQCPWLSVPSTRRQPTAARRLELFVILSQRTLPSSPSQEGFVRAAGCPARPLPPSPVPPSTVSSEGHGAARHAGVQARRLSEPRRAGVGRPRPPSRTKTKHRWEHRPAPPPLSAACASPCHSLFDATTVTRERGGGSGCRSLCLLSNGCRPHRVLRGTNPEQERHTERPEAGRIAFPASGGGGVLRPLRYFPHFSARSLPRSHLIASRVELRFPRPEVSVVVGGFSSFSFHSVGCINTGARSASPLHPDSGGFPLETAAGTGGVSSRCHWDALQPMFLLITS